MPMKLNVGLNRKVGEPNYGSRGASVHFEVEIESDAVRHPQELHEKIRYLFGQARQAVDEELQAPAGESQANGSCQRNGNNNGGSERQATDSQHKALRAICQKHGFNLDQEVSNLFGLRRVDDLTLKQASQLIDDLNEQVQHSGGRR